jgi:hypothetical protein
MRYKKVSAFCVMHGAISEDIEQRLGGEGAIFVGFATEFLRGDGSAEGRRRRLAFGDFRVRIVDKRARKIVGCVGFGGKSIGQVHSKFSFESRQ